jgi:WD40 repeat protein
MLDDSIRQWTRDGKPVGRPWNIDGGPVSSIAISPDESMVASGSADGRLWNVRKGSLVGDPWNGHNDAVMCLQVDWSPNALEIASGSDDSTIRWNPDTGRQIAPPMTIGQGKVYTVRYSPQRDKFTSAGEDKVIRVWSMDGELLIEINGHEGVVPLSFMLFSAPGLIRKG